MSNMRMNISRLVADEIIPENMMDDGVIKALCNQTRMSADTRKALIIMYVALIKDVDV